MPATAHQHFHDDIARARAIIDHAHGLPTGTVAEQTLRSDILRSGWMFAVGALDAYFCDAYTDIIAATIISKARHAAMVVPEFFQKIRFPVRSFLEKYDVNENWRWRMAARELMAKENVLSLETIQALFKRFLRPQHRFFQDVSDEHIHVEFRQFLLGCHCPPAIVAQAGY